MKARQLMFTEPGSVSLREISIREPGEGEVLVKALYCGISPGTERLAYRGEFPPGLLLDETIEELHEKAEYPFTYGYILIGRVVKAGSLSSSYLEGKKVLVFHPHQDLINIKAERAIILPEDISPELCVLAPGCETAVTFLQDAAPLMGEKAVIYGLGIIGQITASMLSSYPLEKLYLVDPSLYRRKMASGIENAFISDISEISGLEDGADLSFEISGNPAALQSAVDNSAYSGRILAGSWYGNKKLSLDLGSSFHRKRISIFSSQVSTIAPLLRGRWTHRRRMDTALKWLAVNGNPAWISHRISFENVSEAYELINKAGGEYLQVILDMN